jgi:hypothetical protein
MAHRANMALDSYIVWLIPRGTVHVTEDGPPWDFDAPATDVGMRRLTWADTVTSLSEWAQVAQVPVLMEHERPRGPGEPVTIWGHLSEVFALTAGEAEAAGLEAYQLTDALYARVVPGGDLASLRESGKVGLGSPSLRLAYTDDTGREWPIILTEYSHTASPRQKPRQVTPQSLLAAALSEAESMTTAKGRRTAKLNEDEAAAAAADDAAGAVEGAAEAGADDAADAGMPALAAAVEAMGGQIAQILEILATMTAAPMADGAKPPPEDAAAIMSEKRVRAVATATVQDVLAARAKREAEQAKLLAEYAIGEEEAAVLCELPADRRKVLLAGRPKRRPGVTVALADGSIGMGGEASLSERATELADREGIKFSEAVARLTTKKKGA